MPKNYFSTEPDNDVDELAKTVWLEIEQFLDMHPAYTDIHITYAEDRADNEGVSVMVIAKSPKKEVTSCVYPAMRFWHLVEDKEAEK